VVFCHYQQQQQHHQHHQVIFVVCLCETFVRANLVLWFQYYCFKTCIAGRLKVKMPMFLSSLPFFISLSVGNHYVKNIHTQRGDLACRMSEFAPEQISFVHSQCILCIYAD
jgi:hypothetical protein